jgi:hypothetical protein
MHSKAQMAKYDHLPLRVRERERIRNTYDYFDGKITSMELKRLEDGTDRWQASRLLMSGEITPKEFRGIEPAYKVNYGEAFLALARRALGMNDTGRTVTRRDEFGETEVENDTLNVGNPNGAQPSAPNSTATTTGNADTSGKPERTVLHDDGELEVLKPEKKAK